MTAKIMLTIVYALFLFVSYMLWYYMFLLLASKHLWMCDHLGS